MREPCGRCEEHESARAAGAARRASIESSCEIRLERPIGSILPKECRRREAQSPRRVSAAGGGMADQQDVRRIALALPESRERTSGSPSRCSTRASRRASCGRGTSASNRRSRGPRDDVVAVRVVDEQDKQALLQSDARCSSPSRTTTASRRCWCGCRCRLRAAGGADRGRLALPGPAGVGRLLPPRRRGMISPRPRSRSRGGRTRRGWLRERRAGAGLSRDDGSPPRRGRRGR